MIAEKNGKRLGRPQLRVALLLLTGAFCLSNGIWDWFRLSGAVHAPSESLLVQAFRLVCVLAGLFMLSFVGRAFVLMKKGTLVAYSERERVGTGWSVIVYSVGGQEYEKAAHLNRPTWLFGKVLDQVVCKPENPRHSMVVYDWMLPWKTDASASTQAR